MDIHIREENPNDYDAVFKLIEDAFQNEIHSDHKEQFLVEKLRNAPAFIPELSLVAEINKEIAGYILLTQIQINSEKEQHVALALAPVAVLQKYQKQGIGSLLINEAHSRARKQGYKVIVVLGHEHYYPRFGYKRAGIYNISLPFEVPPENAMVLELFPNALKDVNGVVQYDPCFYE